MIVLTVVAILFVGNREGLWYPKDPGDEISVLERGENYRWLVVVQREAAQAAANLPDDVVVYYGFAEHFFLKYPWQGYADRTHPGGRCLALREEKPESLNLKDFPKRFFVVYTNPRLFGYEAHKLLRNATKDPSRQVQLFRRCQRGPYRIDIVEVTTIAKSELEQVTP